MARLLNGGNGAISMATLWPTNASQIQTTNARTSTLYDITLTDGTRLQYTGTGLTYTPLSVTLFIPSGGTYSSINLRTSAGLSLAVIDQFGSRNAGEIVGSNPSPLASVFSGADSILGSSFADSLIGEDGADTISGGDGDDTIAAGNSFDSLDGGGGIDTHILTHFNGGNQWNMTTGVLTFTGFPGSVETAINFEIAILGNGDDSISGTSGNNTLIGNGGNDTLDGGLGNDNLVGGAGNDVYVIDSTSDLIQESGSDAADEVRTTLQSFTLGSTAGSAGVERLTYTGFNSFVGTGSFANNTITGGGGGDRLDGAGGNDRLVGNGGNDTLDGGAGDDTLVGVAGNTVYVVDSTADVIVESALDTADEVRTTLNTFTLGADSANVENLTFIGTGNFIGEGDGAGNIITGGAGNDTLFGFGGADTLIGGDGQDLFSYRSNEEIGGDVIDGGASQRTGPGDYLEIAFTGIADFTTATFASTGGNTSIEQLELFGTDHSVIFNAAQFGPSRISTGLIVSGDNGTDVVTINAIDGAFSAAGFEIVNWNDALSRIVLNGGTGVDNITGSSRADSITGGGGNDTLDGGAGNDTLVGGAGNDVYVVDSLNDVITEAPGDDADELRTTLNAFSLGSDANSANVENLTFIGTGNFSGVGDGAGNIITGGAGNDTLFGFGGADTLIGGDGHDDFAYRSNQEIGGDVIDGGASQGTGPGDYLEIAFTGIADFTTATFASTGGNTSIERLELFGTDHSVIFNAAQFGPSRISTGLIVSGDNGTDVVTINAIDGAFSAAGFEIINWNDALSRIIINGGGNADSITGSSRVDSITGNGGNDTLAGGAGNDSLDGGADNDTVTFTGARANYTIAAIANGFTVTDNRGAGFDGVDTVLNTETFVFADQTRTSATLINAPPGAPSLAGNTVAENSAAGTVVGTLSASDPDGTTPGFQIVGGSGASVFAISGNTLVVAPGAALDFEAGATRDVQVIATDGALGSAAQSFTINLSNVNEAPTAPALAGNTVAENSAAGTVVGTLSSTDPDGTSPGFQIVGGSGASLFAISGNTLVVAPGAALDFEAGATRDVQVIATDGALGSAAQSFTINLSNVNETPSVPSLAGNTVAENSAAGTVIGTLSASDPDGTTPGFQIVGGSGASLFAISGNTLVVAPGAALDFEAGATRDVQVIATDGALGSAAQSFTINLSNVNEAPGAPSLAGNTVAENAGAGTVVGTLSAGDPDGNPVTFTLDAAGAALFDLVGNELRIKAGANIDFESGATRSFNARTVDPSGLQSGEVSFTLNITNVNEAPGAASLAGNTVAENAAAGTVVGTLSASDPDGTAPGFQITGGSGASLFTISGNALVVAPGAALDFEALPSRTIEIAAFDGEFSSVAQTFTVTLTDAQEGDSGGIRGLDVADFLNGTPGADVIAGNGGNDTVRGLGGPDALYGHADNDVLIGDGPLLLNAQAQTVRRLYIATLDRGPDDDGWQDWTARLTNGQPLDEIAAGFVGSQEFLNRYGNLDNSGFVTLLYRNVLDREPDAGGLAAFTGALDTGALTRTQVVTSFSESPELRTGTSPEVNAGQVFRLYGATLARQPDSGGFETWTDALGNGRGLAEVAGGFVGSVEFQNVYGALDTTGFVTLLYQNVLGRAPDAGGLAFWSGLLETGGQTRTQVVTGFSESTEYINGTRAGVDAFMRSVMTIWSDTLTGGPGDDRLTGGRGSDRFVFTASEGGADSIIGFESFDTLDLTGFGFTSPAQALAAVSQQGADSVLSYAGGSITFVDTQVGVLQGLSAQGWVLG